MKTRFAIALALAGCGGASPPPQKVVVPAQPMPVASAAPPPVAPTAAPVAAPPPFRIVLLSTGSPNCGLDASGREWTWYGGTLEKTEAVVPNARSFACDLAHACAATTDGKAFCWGQNSYGKLGDGTEQFHATPTLVKGLSDVAEIGTNGERTCARTTSGSVYCWGDSEFGKAGDGRLPDNVGREKMLAGSAILTNAVGLAVGSAHAFALLPDGKLSCWGQNNSLSCGFPASKRYLPHPAPVPKSAGIAAISAGESATCTVDTKGAVACFGRKLGGDGYLSSDKPVAVPLPEAAVEVAVGWASHACARLVSGAVQCWGENDVGQLGDGTKTDSATPVAVFGLRGLGKTTRIAADGERTCALLENGHVWCWGKELGPNGDPARIPAEIK